ncbi:SDR family oxidoreductase [Micromonospora sp. DT81.3]|uniref:SDR family oxidoreductase n=1 Tax=Micromonospora sp. DT81.3 TaxID=3416523 RepID=UPI003CEAAD35
MTPPSPARLRWRIPLPDLTGSLAVVTGASDGVGFEIARALAGIGAELVLPVRIREKGESAAARIRRDHPRAVLTLRDLDLASRSSAGTLVRQLTDEGRPIDILVANAGIMLLRDPVRHVSADGHELHFQTNFLGHASLLLGILPLLRASRARIALQCSLAADHYGIAWDDLEVQRRYTAMRAYASSKIALGLLGMELHRRHGPEAYGEGVPGGGIRVVLCHPGVALTNIAPAEMRAGRDLRTRASLAVLGRGPFGQSAAEAALPALHAVTSADAAGGGFVAPSGPFHLGGPPKAQRPFRNVADPVAGTRLWAALEALLANPKAAPPRTTL